MASRQRLSRLSTKAPFSLRIASTRSSASRATSIRGFSAYTLSQQRNVQRYRLTYISCALEVSHHYSNTALDHANYFQATGLAFERRKLQYKHSTIWFVWHNLFVAALTFLIAETTVKVPEMAESITEGTLKQFNKRMWMLPWMGFHGSY